jgi:hypothetical protein
MGLFVSLDLLLGIWGSMAIQATVGILSIPGETETLRSQVREVITGSGYEVEPRNGALLVTRPLRVGSISWRGLISWHTRIRFKEGEVVVEGPSVGVLHLQRIIGGEEYGALPRSLGSLLPKWTGLVVVALIIVLASTIDWEGGRIGEIAWAPDGTRIAFISGDLICILNVHNRHIWCLDNALALPASRRVQKPHLSPPGAQMPPILQSWLLRQSLLE